LLLIRNSKGDLLPTSVTTTGVVNPNRDDGPLGTSANPNGISFMEWSNNLARIWSMQGKMVHVWFTAAASPTEVLPPDKPDGLLEAN
jgi:hypothetical protein